MPNENMIAKAENQHCLAKGCGCFSCVERCEYDAIKLIPGTGISIDEAHLGGISVGLGLGWLIKCFIDLQGASYAKQS